MIKIAIISFLLLPFIGLSQANLVAYSKDYEFSEGIFLTVHQFRNNSPIPKSSIISEGYKDNADFLKQELKQKNIVYKDANNGEHRIESSGVWGFTQNRTIYINYNNSFNRVNVIGTWMQFTALIVSSPGFMDPMYSNYSLNTTIEELKQFVFDTETNKIVPFDVKNMSVLLKSDSELYEQYMALGKREMTDSQFIYLRKFNEKHPLMLPGK